MEFTEILMMVIKAVVGLALTAAATWASAWLAQKKKEMEAQGSRDLEERFICLAQDAVDTAVDLVNQTMVSGIKGTEAWTDEAMEKAYAAAEVAAQQILGDDGVEALDTLFGSAEVWMKAKIEQAVLRSK